MNEGCFVKDSFGNLVPYDDRDFEIKDEFELIMDEAMEIVDKYFVLVSTAEDRTWRKTYASHYFKMLDNLIREKDGE